VAGEEPRKRYKGEKAPQGGPKGKGKNRSEIQPQDEGTEGGGNSRPWGWSKKKTTRPDRPCREAGRATGEAPYRQQKKKENHTRREKGKGLRERYLEATILPIDHILKKGGDGHNGKETGTGAAPG